MLVIGSSQNLASSESSDMGEYCNGKSSLCYQTHMNEVKTIYKDSREKSIGDNFKIKVCEIVASFGLGIFTKSLTK